MSDSSGQIDGYLAARYTLPLVSVPQNLVRLCCDLARYRLASMSHVTITEEIITWYKLSLKELEDSVGKISPVTPTENNDANEHDNGAWFLLIRNTGFLRVITRIENAHVERLQRGFRAFSQYR